MKHHYVIDGFAVHVTPIRLGYEAYTELNGCLITTTFTIEGIETGTLVLQANETEESCPSDYVPDPRCQTALEKAVRKVIDQRLK